MKTNELTREQISAFADGELDAAQQDAMLAALRGEEARADWELYHQIGDVLRSDEMAGGMSRAFSARLAACLETEPVYIAPAAAAARRPRLRVIQSMAAAAAVATFAFVVTPSLMEALQGEPAHAPALAAATAPQDEQIVATDVSEGVILRDPRIDDYLIAHQRFSPSVNGSAQYVRSATFSGK
jgi:sigma-E factor negative regulatory protein RseA